MPDQAELHGPVPDVFDPAKRYRVNLSRSVIVHGIIAVNPAENPVLDGATAESVRDAIVGAAEES